jgi:hypothetical protein
LHEVIKRFSFEAEFEIKEADTLFKSSEREGNYYYECDSNSKASMTGDTAERSFSVKYFNGSCF